MTFKCHVKGILLLSSENKHAHEEEKVVFSEDMSLRAKWKCSKLYYRMSQKLDHLKLD